MVTLEVNVTGRLPVTSHAPTWMLVVTCGQQLHGIGPVKVALQGGLKPGQVAVTVTTDPQRQFDGMVTDQVPPVTVAVPPEAVFRHLTLTFTTPGVQAVAVPCTTTSVVEEDVGVPRTDVMVTVHMGRTN